MKLSININSTILFYIFQLKLRKERHTKMSSMHSLTNNNNVDTSTTTSSTTTTANGLYKKQLALGYKPQGSILVPLHNHHNNNHKQK